MRMRAFLNLIALTCLLGVAGSAREPGAFATAADRELQRVDWGYPTSFLHGSPLLYAQGWPGYGYPSFGGSSYHPYNHSSHFPYLYFYEQYAREAEESRRAADEYEASLAREGKLTGPLEVGAFATDFLPRSPLQQQVTLDGQTVAPSPSGAPLGIESGEHTLIIGSHN
jgi:hypothetical protein